MDGIHNNQPSKPQTVQSAGLRMRSQACVTWTPRDENPSSGSMSNPAQGLPSLPGVPGSPGRNASLLNLKVHFATVDSFSLWPFRAFANGVGRDGQVTKMFLSSRCQDRKVAPIPSITTSFPAFRATNRPRCSRNSASRNVPNAGGDMRRAGVASVWLLCCCGIITAASDQLAYLARLLTGSHTHT